MSADTVDCTGVRHDEATPVLRPGASSGPASNGDDPAWVDICALADVPVLGARVVARAAGGNIAVFRNADDRVFALLDRCPHKGGPLSQGIVFGERVACPLHNWTIELETGCATAPDEGCTRLFAVMVRGGRVYLESAALHGGVEVRSPAGESEATLTPW